MRMAIFRYVGTEVNPFVAGQAFIPFKDTQVADPQLAAQLRSNINFMEVVMSAAVKETVSFVSETDTRQFGYEFKAGKPVEIADPVMIGKLRGNRFFAEVGADEPPEAEAAKLREQENTRQGIGLTERLQAQGAPDPIVAPDVKAGKPGSKAWNDQQVAASVKRGPGRPPSKG